MTQHERNQQFAEALARFAAATPALAESTRHIAEANRRIEAAFRQVGRAVVAAEARRRGLTVDEYLAQCVALVRRRMDAEGAR